MDLSVIIVSYNVRYFLDLCLSSVRKAAEGISCEVFVVDNNSPDGSCSMVSTNYPEVKLIENKDNKGFAAANNQAIKQASGKYLLLLNPDTFIGEDTFRNCITFMDKHPDAGAMGVMMINGKGKYLPESKRGLPDPGTAFYRISGLSYLLPRSGRFNKYYLGDLDKNETHAVDIISGAFMFLRREAVLKAGLPDESFFMYGEDIDYSYRIIKEGFKNYYFPEVKILHFKGESTKKENIDFVVNFYRAMLIFVRKHFNDGYFKKMSFAIRTAIFFRAGLSVVHRSFKRIFIPVAKGISSASKPLRTGSGHSRPVKTAIVSDTEGYSKVTEFLSLSGIPAETVRISPGMNEGDKNNAGNINNINEILKGNRIGQVIFTAGRMKATTIIDSMIRISDQKVKIKIAFNEEKFLVGSGSVTTPVK
jgi:GT2 family glycosyltransferase